MGEARDVAVELAEALGVAEASSNGGGGVGVAAAGEVDEGGGGESLAPPIEAGCGED